MTGAKKSAFWVIMLLLPFVFLMLAVEAYYLYGYVTLRADYCRSFAQVDDELGWSLKPDTESCVIGRAMAFGDEVFRAKVHLDRNGGRIPHAGAISPVEGLLAIGDSWTFGYGIDGNETFAARLTADHDRPTALFASPAYSGAQALLLAKRIAPVLKPRAIIYLELGFWGRAVCSGNEQPVRILKPCYWVDGDGLAHLIVPPSGFVRRMAAFGVKPGGMVGAGEKNLSYFLISRPVAKLSGFMVRLGIANGFADDFAPVAPEKELTAIKLAHGQNLLAFANNVDATLILIDPTGVYEPLFGSDQKDAGVLYIGQQLWKREVGSRIASLQPDEARVPSDGHFGPGVHRFIANMIDEALDNHANR